MTMHTVPLNVYCANVMHVPLLCTYCCHTKRLSHIIMTQCHHGNYFIVGDDDAFASAEFLMDGQVWLQHLHVLQFTYILFRDCKFKMKDYGGPN